MDAMVELANQMVALSYAALALENHLTRRRREHVRLLLTETQEALERITRGIQC